MFIWVEGPWCNGIGVVCLIRDSVFPTGPIKLPLVNSTLEQGPLGQTEGVPYKQTKQAF